MATLPQEMIVEILLRLPPKPFYRFKTVAKPWNSIISTPKFMKNYLKQTLIMSNLIISHDSLSTAEFPTTADNLRFSAVDHPVTHPSHHPFVKILGSCDGILIISDRFKQTLFLFNPTTKTHRLIPPPPSNIPDTEIPELARYIPNVYKPVDHIVVFGFGYDPKSDDYKLLRVIECYNDRVQTSREVRLYSMRDNTWKNIDDEVICPNLDMDGVHVNGVLYFIVENEFKKQMVKCFDLRTETFSHFEMFPKDRVCDNFYPVLKELGGCFCVMGNYQEYDVNVNFGLKLARCDLWVMKEYGKEESWVRLFSIVDPSGIGCFMTIRPVVYSKDGGRVLLEVDDCEFGWYDWGRKEFEKVEASGLPSRDSGFITYTFEPSLVSVEKGKLVPRKNINKKNVDGFLSTGFKLKL